MKTTRNNIFLKLALIAILAISTAFLNLVLAQKETNNWYFGHNAGLSFASGSPVPVINGKLNTGEGCATISDTAGNLLFYTDGLQVWNKNHQVMANGSGLLGHWSSSQSAVAFPKPLNDSLYYLFTVGVDMSNSLMYSVINIKRQGGLGEVIQKNIPLLDSAIEKLTAVKHCNNRDIWLVTRKFGSNAYSAILITPGGISSPVITRVGDVVSGANKNAIGIMKFSPNGKKLAAAHSFESDFIELLDFNYETGQLSNPVKLFVRPSYANSIDVGVYGLEFSSNNASLYASSYYPITGRTLIHKFDVSQANQSLIQNSRLRIDSQTNRQYGGMQLAKDGKIYVTENEKNYLSVINNPNAIGSAVNFTPRSLNLGPSSTNYSYIGLPTFLQTYLQPGNNVYDFTVSNNCTSKSVSFILTNSVGIDSLKWDFSDITTGISNTSVNYTPTHIFSKSGSFDVKLIIYRGSCSFNDTVKKTIWVGPSTLNLGSDQIHCEGEGINLNAGIEALDALYTWNTGLTTPTIIVNQSGQYDVKVNIGECIYRDTVNISFKPRPSEFSIGDSVVFCASENFILSPTPIPVSGSFLWNTGSSSPTITPNQSGWHWLKVTNSFGCATTDSAYITINEVPVFTLGSDKVFCSGDSITLIATPNNASYLWNTTATTKSLVVNNPGLYWAEVSKGGCTYRDSINVTMNLTPIVNLGSDTTLCEGITMTLDASNVGSLHKWQDNSVNQTFLVNKAGSYSVTVTKDGCTDTDTVSISYDLKPLFTFSGPLKICEDQIIQLKPSILKGQDLSFTWHDGSANTSYQISQPGIYSLKLQNNCGIDFKSIEVSKGNCKVYIPTAFTPNQDGHNDIFRANSDEAMISFKLSVYNRWGENIFETTDIKKGWDGKLKGVLLSSDTFVYVVHFQTIKDKTLQVRSGSFVLIR